MNCTNRLAHSTRIALVFLLIFPLVELPCGQASAQGLEFWNKPCLKLYKKWKSEAEHKAFAVSNSNAGSQTGQSCAYSYKYPSKASAEAAAVKSCESERHYRSGRCYVTKSE